MRSHSGQTLQIRVNTESTLRGAKHFNNAPTAMPVTQCFLSRFWVSKWHPKTLQWHPKFWKTKYGFALYWSKTIWDKHVFLHVAIATDGCNVIGRHNFLWQKLEAKILSFGIWAYRGWSRGGATGAIDPPKTNESYFIYHDFVKFGKQYSQYNSENSIRNKTWLQNITEIAPLTLPAGSAPVCIVMRTASASYYTAADLDSMGYETAKAL